MKKFCLPFMHKYKTVHEILGEYHTTSTWDTPGDLGIEYYDVYLEECTECRKRRMVVAGGKHKRSHKGLERLKYRWLRRKDIHGYY